MFVIPKPLAIEELEQLLLEYGLMKPERWVSRASGSLPQALDYVNLPLQTKATPYTDYHQRSHTMMIMIRAIVRPEKADAVLAALMDAGFPAVTKIFGSGRGKQRGIKIGEVTYDEIPKEMLMSVVQERTRISWSSTIMKTARTGTKGAFGDGKIFVSRCRGSLHHQLGRQGRTAEEAV